MSPILPGRLEVLPSLTFSCKEKWIIDTIEEFVENFYSVKYSDNLYLADDANDSDDEEDNDYQTINLETEDEEEDTVESKQVDLEIDKNLDIPIVTDDE